MVAMDIIGHILLNERENCFILKVFDNFTKQVQAYALPYQEAETISGVFFNELIARLFVPHVIQTV